MAAWAIELDKRAYKLAREVYGKTPFADVRSDADH